ncbi:hypothetical protein PQE70_gp126 [Bacillus phage vB_BanS_Nate]|uniref:Uncharacterized protein n=1 Tax=Bacillus phage vB_BanS_Nate TaxID=2894788 RepID=A0AAE9CE82_9CAUD|nr:hypothetical protein PQE70_gp126 [Bacillus phage vB_BanS_Nate]UGO50979.1 hypothetical protein NATE_126 [Bacillus phage vB_BanS_Nate]
MNIKKINTMKMLEKILWGRVANMELEDADGSYKNVILSQENLATFLDGEKIQLSRTFLNREWVFVPKYKTFMEAHKDSESQQHLIHCMHGEGLTVHAETGLESIFLQQFLNISFQDLIEDKYWVSFRDVTLFPVSIMDVNESSGVTFVGAIEKLLLSDSHFLVQFNTDRKIFIDEFGVKDASTGELLELDGSLQTAGYWYIGDEVSGDGSMKIIDALSYIDWNTQELVFGEGTEDEFVIPTRAVYEDIDLKDMLPEHSQDVNIKQIFTQQVWKVRNKTV